MGASTANRPTRTAICPDCTLGQMGGVEAWMQYVCAGIDDTVRTHCLHPVCLKVTAFAIAVRKGHTHPINPADLGLHFDDRGRHYWRHRTTDPLPSWVWDVDGIPSCIVSWDNAPAGTPIPHMLMPDTMNTEGLLGEELFRTANMSAFGPRLATLGLRAPWHIDIANPLNDMTDTVPWSAAILPNPEEIGTDGNLTELDIKMQVHASFKMTPQSGVDAVAIGDPWRNDGFGGGTAGLKAPPAAPADDWGRTATAAMASADWPTVGGNPPQQGDQGRAPASATTTISDAGGPPHCTGDTARHHSYKKSWYGQSWDDKWKVDQAHE